MNDQQIHQYVQTVLNSAKTQFNYLDVIGDSNKQFKLRAANRLLKAWHKKQNEKITSKDFEIVLRDYLLLFKEAIILPSYEPSKDFTKLGFIRNQNDGNTWVNLSMPTYLNSRFVQKTYSDSMTEETYTRALLNTNTFIRNLTGFDTYKSEEQKLVVTGALRTPPGYTSLVAMSTGGGKSLVIQSLSYQLDEGLTIVIVPTVSLMMDQMRNAKKILKNHAEGEIFAYYSGVDNKAFLRALTHKKARLFFTSPEALVKNKQLLEAIEKANDDKYLKNIVIDEAHIISEWGSSFRVDFQCIDALRKRFLRSNDDLRTFLLSATFSKRTVELLKLVYSEGNNWLEFRCDKLRTEIHFDIVRSRNYSEKKDRLLEMVSLLPHPMIVYVNKPDDAEKLQCELKEQGITNTRVFTGRTSSTERELLIEGWAQDEFPIMIATCAFGVGVDKKDVRTVLHTYIPENPNKYYQEAGRGGRDGLPCLSLLLYTEQDIDSAFAFTSKVLTVEKLIGRWFSLIESSKANKKVGGIIKIDTSVKPSYTESDDEFGWANEADINWNVYVILLLRRAGLIEVVDLEFDRRYLFTVKLLNSKIAFNTNETFDIFEAVRAAEWNETVKDFQKMANSLKRVGRCCWSDMFNDVYNLTDAFCAGCNNHDETISDRSSSFALKKAVRLQFDIDSCLFDRYLGVAKSGICYTEDFSNCIQKLCNLGVSTFVGFDFEESKMLSSKPELAIWTIKEFIELIKMGDFYLNGCIAIKLPSQEDDIVRMLAISENVTYMSGMKLIFICNDDPFIRTRGKHLSEIIDGPCIKSQILEDKNV